MDVDKITIEDCMCSICMCIFVEPVTMPCTHTLCMPCFKQNVEATSLTCPLCRKRISTWARKAAREKCLVNIALWAKIQSMFPDRVERRLEGEDQEDDMAMDGLLLVLYKCITEILSVPVEHLHRVENNKNY